MGSVLCVIVAVTMDIFLCCLETETLVTRWFCVAVLSAGSGLACCWGLLLPLCCLHGTGTVPYGPSAVLYVRTYVRILREIRECCRNSQVGFDRRHAKHCDAICRLIQKAKRRVKKSTNTTIWRDHRGGP